MASDFVDYFWQCIHIKFLESDATVRHNNLKFTFRVVMAMVVLRLLCQSTRPKVCSYLYVNVTLRCHADMSPQNCQSRILPFARKRIGSCAPFFWDYFSLKGPRSIQGIKPSLAHFAAICLQSCLCLLPFGVHQSKLPSTAFIGRICKIIDCVIV